MSHEEGFAPEDSAPATGNNATDRTSLSKLLAKAIGLDITSISIPVTYNEPTSFLQRILEMQEDYNLLNLADRFSKNYPDVALLYVTAYAVSMFAGTERTAKSFNPLLGETFEYSFADGTAFYSEQVSHHPPIGATKLENEHFELEQWHLVKTKFLGNSLEIPPTGKTDIRLKSSNRRYRFTGCWTLVQNVVIGRMWVDHYGDIEVNEVGTKRKAILKFTKCGWFSKGWHEVSGHSYNDDGDEAFLITALWNQNFYATELPNGSKKEKKKVAKMIKKKAKAERKMQKAEKKSKSKSSNRENGALSSRTTSPPESKSGNSGLSSANEDGSDSDEDDEDDDQLPMFEDGKPVCLWTHNTVVTDKAPYKKWGLTEFTVNLCKLTDEMKITLPPTDSRFRKDRLSLEAEDNKAAGQHKHEMEEAQRARARYREENGIEYKPQYFKLITDDHGEEHWVALNNYWKKKNERLGIVEKNVMKKKDAKQEDKEDEKEKEEKEEKEGKDSAAKRDKKGDRSSKSSRSRAASPRDE